MAAVGECSACPVARISATLLRPVAAAHAARRPMVGLVGKGRSLGGLSARVRGRLLRRARAPRMRHAGAARARRAGAARSREAPAAGPGWRGGVPFAAATAARSAPSGACRGAQRRSPGAETRAVAAWSACPRPRPSAPQGARSRRGMRRSSRPGSSTRLAGRVVGAARRLLRTRGKQARRATRWIRRTCRRARAPRTARLRGGVQPVSGRCGGDAAPRRLSERAPC